MWRWRLHSQISGKLYITRYAMTEADALELDPLAERLDFSKEVRLVPETEAEMDQLRTSSMLRPRS
jgi:hypothetical protein